MVVVVVISREKLKERVCRRYRKEVTRIIKAKYKRRAYTEAKAKKFYFMRTEEIRGQVLKLEAEIFKAYQPAYLAEIETKVQEFENSEKCQTAIDIELNLYKKHLSYKILKRYQEFNINIGTKFMRCLYEEVNRDTKKVIIEEEEIKYILLLILYKIIDLIKDGFQVKIGTLFYIWLKKRDVRVNLPHVKQKIIQDRLIPAVKLCKNFDRNLFLEVNKENTAILNYYRAKTERFLSLIRKNK